MAKSIYTDGVWAVMHFNSSVESYRAAREFGFRGSECCYCHQKLAPELPYNPGKSIFGKCAYCQNPVEYRTIYLTREIALHFDVRGGTMYGSPLGIGGIMHIVLPPNAEEFNALLRGLSRQESMIVPSSEKNFLLLDFVSRVVNLTDTKFSTMVAEKRSQKIDFSQAPNIYSLAQGFLDFGTVVSPRPIAYSPRAKSSLNIMVENAAEELENFLLNKFDNHLSESDIEKIQHGLLGICYDFIKRNWESKLETLYKQSVSLTKDKLDQFLSDLGYQLTRNNEKWTIEHPNGMIGYAYSIDRLKSDVENIAHKHGFTIDWVD